MYKLFLIILVSVNLSACITLSGNYEVKAVDANGNALNKGMVLIATGSGIYTVRNALCQSFPKAKIIIIDSQTKQELTSESPYQCR